MKHLFMTIILVHATALTTAQSLQPVETHCLVRVEVLDHAQQPIQELLTFEAKYSNQKFSLQTDTLGKGEILLPRNTIYALHLEFLPNYDVIELPNLPHHIFEYQATSNKRLKQVAHLTKVSISVKNRRRQPISEQITLQSATTQQNYAAKLDVQGQAVINVPKNDTYWVHYERAPKYDKIVLPDKPNYTHLYDAVFEGSHPDTLYASLDRSLMEFQFVDLDEQPVEGEKFYVKNVKTKRVDSVITNIHGKTRLYVPLDAIYSVSVTNWENFTTYVLPPQEGLYHARIRLRFVPTKLWRLREARMKDWVEEREKKWQEWQKLYAIDPDAARRSPSYYWNIDSVYVAVMRRHPQWRKKMVVMDATGSMQPYDDQIELWYQLHFAKEKNDLQFTLFNDGDGIIDAAKRVGSTGGIYACDNCSFLEFSKLLKHVRQKGNGGDAPENDIEALLEAQKRCTDDTELILVADSHCAVIDMALVNKIKKPVKVIVCGALIGQIHPDYLTIAYQTNGSLHTIERDITDLRTNLDGAKVKIGQSIFTLTKGRFVLYKADNEKE